LSMPRRSAQVLEGTELVVELEAHAYGALLQLHRRHGRDRSRILLFEEVGRGELHRVRVHEPICRGSTNATAASSLDDPETRDAQEIGRIPDDPNLSCWLRLQSA
jgi:hypothetical protein